MALTDLQKEKYLCTTLLENIGLEGQEKLLGSKVLVIGAGGLGSSSLLYLNSIGVGEIGVVDFDKVSLSNLPRQILYNESDVDKSKVKVVEKKLSLHNADSKVKTYELKLTSENVVEIISGYDIVLDCVDNFETKILINDACRNMGMPYVSAGVSGYKGQIMFVSPNSKSDIKSLIKEDEELKEKDAQNDHRVFPLAVALVSNIQCSEAIKYLLNIGNNLVDKCLVIDLLNNKFDTYNVK